MRKLLLILLTVSVFLTAHAEWNTHFAYNNVSHIELADDYVYGFSNGSLFRIHRYTDAIEKVDSKFGLHGTDVSALAYDSVSHKLLIAYTNGKADLIIGRRVDYLPDLYLKDMLENKKVNNITFYEGRAYLSMTFGVVSFSMYDHVYMDTYRIGANGADVNVSDVVIRADSIFAIGTDSVYRAALGTNLMDYRNWQAEAKGRIIPNPNKGLYAVDRDGNQWLAAGNQGIKKVSVNGDEHFYKPDGPASNISYRLFVGATGRLYMLQGGRWDDFFNRPGDVMIYENGVWRTITAADSRQRLGLNHNVLDFMSLAEDPVDADHLFVSSWQSGLYEFRGDSAVMHYDASNSTVKPVLPDFPLQYNACDGITFDHQNNMWVMLGYRGEKNIAIRKADGTWTTFPIIINGQEEPVFRLGRVLFDHRNPNHVILQSVATSDVGIVAIDHKGTLDDLTDDVTIHTHSWIDQDGAEVTPSRFLSLIQARNNDLWLGTNKGVIRIPDSVDILSSNACVRLRIQDGDGYLTEGEQIEAVCQDGLGHIWVGSTTQGVYVLSEEGDSLLARYNTGSCPLPSNSILSLEYDAIHDIMYVGTGEGLISMSNTRGEEQGLIQEPDVDTEGSMFHFTLYPSYANTLQVCVASDEVYAMAENALFSVNRESKQITTYDKTMGLSGTQVTHIGHDNQTDFTVVVYADGYIDLIRGGSLYSMSDLFLRSEDLSVDINSLCMDGHGRCYLAMNFGIVAINLSKQEVEGTYYVGPEGKNVKVLSIATSADTIYATSEEYLFVGCRRDNLLDYSNWHHVALVEKGGPSKLVYVNDVLYFLSQKGHLYRYQAGVFTRVDNADYANIFPNRDRLLTYDQQSVLAYLGGEPIGQYRGVADVVCSSDGIWFAAESSGLLHRSNSDDYSFYTPDGPYNNMAYHLQFHGDKLYVANGAGDPNINNEVDIKMYDGNEWSVITRYDMGGAGLGYSRNMMNFAFDPRNPEHYYISSFGTGVLEIRDGKFCHRYSSDNSTLKSAVTKSDSALFVLTAAATMDEQGNLWVLNSESPNAICIMDPAGTWHRLPMSGRSTFKISGNQLIIDHRNPNHKWFFNSRGGAVMYMLDDNGTPTYSGDDKIVAQSTLYDQKGTSVGFNYIYCAVQGPDGIIWVGTDKGPFQIDSPEQFARGRCSRVLNRRNDGTDLADYLLQTEPIQTIAIDGGNRKWFGTQNDGLFLINEDGSQQMEHFTTRNSNLPSNQISSLAIHPRTGEVFIGTAAGICSYKSDATEPMDDYSSAYAYPNPVRPDYDGVVTITGLMENSWVQILDGGGNVVFKTRSYGGTATWDLSNGRGSRVTTGVYSAICTPASHHQHGSGVVKILVMGR